MAMPPGLLLESASCREVYGGRLREGVEVHLPGVGDFHVAGIKKLVDPPGPPGQAHAAL